MPLRCKLFARDRALEACSTQDAAHIDEGAKGDHVSKIQMALFLLDDYAVAAVELRTQIYGPSTGSGVLGFKRKRDLMDRGIAESSLGRLTMAAMDREVICVESKPISPKVPLRNFAVG